MHVTRTSYTSVQGKDLPRRFQTKEDEFVGMFVARGAIELRQADGPWMKGGKASYFLISRRIEFDIRTPRPSECVLGWLSFGIYTLPARMLFRSLPDFIELRDLGKDGFECQFMLELLFHTLPGCPPP